MERFDAFHLPGLLLPSDQPFRELAFGEGASRVVARAPVLSPEQIRDLSLAVRAARERRLDRLPVLVIANLIARAINRWLDPYSPYLRDCERLLPVVTGYPVEAIRKGLPAFLGGYREEHLRRLLDDEFGDPTVLDGFRPRLAASGLTRAFGPRLAAHIFAGNVPGLPAQSLTCTLLVKAASIGKSASEEPCFPVLFARSLAEVDPELGAALAVTWWPGGERSVEEALFDEAEAIIAYGSEAAIESVRAVLPPGRRFIPYGHKISFGLIGREALSRDVIDGTVAAAAYDTAKYDQQGCLSPHLFYLERDGEISPEDFAERLAAELARVQGIIPRGRLNRDEAAAIAELRRRQEFRAALDGRNRLIAPQTNDWTVLLDAQPTFAPSCLNRTIQLRALERLEDAPEHLAPLGHYLQTAAVAVAPERLEPLATALGRLGIDRVCPLGQMADPAPTWHHDGRPNLLDLVRWTDLEAPNSGGRWEFSHPQLGVFGRPILNGQGPMNQPIDTRENAQARAALAARAGVGE